MSSRVIVETPSGAIKKNSSKIPRLLKSGLYNISLSSMSSSLDSNQEILVDAIDVLNGNLQVRVKYRALEQIGNGSFGTVFSATLCEEKSRKVAIKQVLQDKRFKNRELQIIRNLKHSCIVALFYYFYSIPTNKPEDTYLNLVQEFVPDTLSKIIKFYWTQKQPIPLVYIKRYSFQLLRGLAYIHHKGVCHRDVKPQNLLIDHAKGILKICDFGSAKMLLPNEPNVSYICSRFYRAPELIFGAVNYTTSIDLWSSGCVIGELLLGRPLFPGSTSVEQLVEIIRILGTPNQQQVNQMNPQYSPYNFPKIKPTPWEKIILHHNTSSSNLLRRLLVYNPEERASAADALSDSFFQSLFVLPKGHPPSSNTYLPDGRIAPSLVEDFSEEELSYLPNSLINAGPSQIKSASTRPASTSSTVIALSNHQAGQSYLSSHEMDIDAHMAITCLDDPSEEGMNQRRAASKTVSMRMDNNNATRRHHNSFLEHQTPVGSTRSSTFARHHSSDVIGSGLDRKKSLVNDGNNSSRLSEEKSSPLVAKSSSIHMNPISLATFHGSRDHFTNLDDV